MIVAIDHGNKQTKTPNFVYPTSILESDVRPAFSGDILEYKGRFYTAGGPRIPYTRDKSEDERFFYLTLLGIAKEISRTADLPPASSRPLPIELLIGLPPKHYAALCRKFAGFYLRLGPQRFCLNEKEYYIQISEVQVYPQAYAAASRALSKISEYPRSYVIDIGGYTVDYLPINGISPDLNSSGTLENGIISLYNEIIPKISSEFDMLIEECDIDTILLGKKGFYDPQIVRITEEIARNFTSDLLMRLRELKVDLKVSQPLFIGGGAAILEPFIRSLPMAGASPIFDRDIYANARGYYYLYRSGIRQ